MDYSVAGSYVITYSVTDSNGNSTSISRTIHVIDPITEIKARVFVLKDGVERPSNKDRLSIIAKPTHAEPLQQLK